MYSPRKDFESLTNSILGPVLKQHGFVRFKTRNYIRVTNDYLLQIINFQKSAGFMYYINLSSYPLASIHSSFFAEGGFRIEGLGREASTRSTFARFAFGNEYIARENLNGILKFFESTVLCWFDVVGQCRSFCEYEQNVGSGKSAHLGSVLKDRTTDEIHYLFLLLQAERYDEAKTYIDILKNKVAEGKRYLEKYLDQINVVSGFIGQPDVESIRSVIRSNIETNLRSMALTKVKQHQVTPASLDQFLAVQSACFESDEYMGVEEYHQVLKADQGMFDTLREIVQKSYPVIVLSPERFKVPVDKREAFHFAYNTADYVRSDAQEVIEWFERKGQDVNHVKGTLSRIEFWHDFSNRIPYNMTNDLLKLMGKVNTDRIYIPGRGCFATIR